MSRDERRTVQQLSGAPPFVAPAPSQLDPYLGTTIDGRYVVDSLLGEGGMGVVYAGRHRTLDKRVAIKVLKRELADDRDMLERFFNEARAASSIGSPHIVDVADFGMLPDGAAFFVMEYLDGVSLGGLMDQLKLVPTPRLVKIARQMALGLAAAHAAGIVHRDLKPDNVMLVRRGSDNDFVKILDFGIAKVTHAATRLTRTGSVFGTPHYMSPEQAAGLSVDSRGDIYALGIILYEMACGKVPFDSDNYMGILTQHMYKAAPPPRTLVVPPNAVSPGLEAIILKCLTKKPEGRYATAEELIADLDLLAAGSTPAAVPELMARSGNFNAPADYFRSPNGQTQPSLHAAQAGAAQWASDGAPRADRRVGVLVGVGAGLALAAAMIAAFVVHDRRASGAAPLPSTAASITAPPPSAVVVPVVVPVASVAAAPTGAAKRVVLVFVEPGDAQVALPSGAFANVENGLAHIAVADGETLTLNVSRPGYTAAQLAIGPQSKDGVKVALAPIKGGVARPVPSAAPAAAPSAPRVVPTPSAAPPPPSPPPAKPRMSAAACAQVKGSDPTFEFYPECR